jgi:hypothetical protein
MGGTGTIPPPLTCLPQPQKDGMPLKQKYELYAPFNTKNYTLSAN